MEITHGLVKARIIFLIAAYLLGFTMSSAQDKHPYASDQPIPYAKIFPVPGINVIWHFALSPDGQTYYVCADSLWFSNFVDQKWTALKTVKSISLYPIETPFVSYDGAKLFITQMDTAHDNDDVYVLDKTSDGWGEPKNLGAQINSATFEAMATATVGGDLYFLSTRTGTEELYCSKYTNGQYGEPQMLDHMFNRYNALSPFIAADGSYILFVSNMYGDIYISFQKNNSWSVPQNVGKRINTDPTYDDRPNVSPDGNYLFFLSSRKVNARNVYQVDWKPILDSLRNKATWNKAFASSIESRLFPPENAIDGSSTSRWASSAGDSQWFMVKLDSASTINKVVLQWQFAYGKQYEIQTSTDSLNWQTVFTESNGNGGVDEISFSPIKAQYVRMNGIRRGTVYGYSLYEFEIYEENVTVVSPRGDSPKQFLLNQNYPNPFNPSTTIKYSIPAIEALHAMSSPQHVTLKIYDMLGREVATLVDEEKEPGNYHAIFDTNSLTSGIYFYRLEAGKFSETKKMIMLR